MVASNIHTNTMDTDTMAVDASLTIENIINDFKSSGLENENKYTTALQNLLTLACNSDEKLKIITEHLDVKLLFDFLVEDLKNHPTRKTTHNDLCKLLGLVLEKYEPSNVVTKYSSYLVSSMDSGKEEFHSLCLHQLFRLAETENFSVFMSNPDIVVFIIKSSGCESLGTASISKKILNRMFEMEGNSDWLLSTDVYGATSELLNSKSATVRFRIYEIFLDFLKKFPEYLTTLEEKETFNNLLADLFDTNDVLSQLNALELVTQIALTGQQGLEFLGKKGIMGWLQNVVNSDDPFTQFLLPGAIKCFGILGAHNPRIIPKHKIIMDAVFNNLSSEDSSLKCLCAETICFISSKPDALKQLYNEPDALKNSLKIMGKLVSSSSEDQNIKSRVLDAISIMLNHDQIDIESSMICEKLFHHLSNEPVHFLMDLVQQPFLKIRYGALKILRSVSVFSWIEQDMALCAGFLEYLLDRRTETEKEGHELKFGIIKNLSTSNTAQQNLGLGYFEQLNKFAKQGPFYSESQVAVTYEQGS